MILIVGSKGQLGRAVREEAYKRGLRYIGSDRKKLNITDPSAIHTFFKDKNVRFDCIINCAAYTQVDLAESHATEAYAVNAFAPWLLANTGIPIIHVSTDYVFDGHNTTPYGVDDPTSPRSVYGLTKRAGETALLESGAHGVIVRTAWVYSSRQETKNFYHTILRLGFERETLGVVHDQKGSPTLAEDLAVALLDLYEKGAYQKPMHLLHFCNSGECSWYDFASEILKGTGAQAQLNPIPTSAYPTPASRPAYSVLDLSTIKQLYNIHPRNWHDALHEAKSRTYSEAPLNFLAETFSQSSNINKHQ